MQLVLGENGKRAAAALGPNEGNRGLDKIKSNLFHFSFLR